VTPFPYRHRFVGPFRKTRTASPTVLLRLQSALARHAIWAFVCALLIPSSSIAAEPPTDLAHFPHPVWDAKRAPDNLLSYFFWVDDDTILFRAGTALKPQTTRQSEAFKFVLYIWHLGQEPQVYVNSDIIHYCAAAGWIQYYIPEYDRNTGMHERVMIEGPLGHEQERPVPATDLPADKTKIPAAVRARGNSLNDPRHIDNADMCLPSAADAGLAGREWVTDTYRRYRIIFGTGALAIRDSSQAAHLVELRRSDGGDPVTLPITIAEADPSCTHFHRFDRAFWVWDCSDVGLNINYVPAADRWHAKHDCWPVWRVMPATADVERICLPYGPWVGSSIELVPTKMGLLFASLNDEAEYPNVRELRDSMNSPVVPRTGF